MDKEVLNEELSEIVGFDLTKLAEIDYLGYLGNLVVALLIFVVGRWVVKLIVKAIGKLMSSRNIDEMLADFICTILTALGTLVVAIAALNRLGVDTTSLVALIGAAGLAVGLALQSSLSNFAAGVMLIVNKPFQAGDFVEAGGVSGVIEEVHIFSTTLRTPDNKSVIVPNGQIYEGSIINYSNRDTRRIDLIMGIGYEDDIKKAKQIMLDIMLADKRILEDPAPVVAVHELADSSVNLAVRPWVKTDDYWGVYWDLLEGFKLAFDNNGISIPYPQQDVYMYQAEK